MPITLQSQIPEFSLYDQNGNLFTSDELYEAPAVIYFYPKDDTPGCTAEACLFRDSLEQFHTLKVRIIGISPDSMSSHLDFAKKYDLKYTLLADPEHKVAEIFGVWTGKGIQRSTFLIDAEGRVIWQEIGVKVDGHIERILNALRSLPL